MNWSRKLVISFALLSLSVVSLSSGYRIFAMIPFKGRSHFKVLEQVVMALTEKGHQVDVISGYPRTEPFPNYTDVVKLQSTQVKVSVDYSELHSRNGIKEAVHSTCLELCDLLGHPEIARIVKNPPKDPPYDLVLTHFFAGYQCYTGVAHLWNVPLVGVVTTAMYPYNHRMIGSPLNLAIASKNLRSHNDKMSFWERLYNVLMTHWEIYTYDMRAYKQDALIKKYLGPDMPSYTELEKSVSLMLTNSHFSFHGVQPNNPAHIEIAGIHIQDDNTTTMSEDLKKILDDSKDGFIYFSFGSLMRLESFPEEVFGKFYSVFRRLAPLRVLVKSVDPKALPKGKPNNVFTFPWFPQEEVLKHPNIRGFITHGGGLGTQETVYYGVPVICVPLFADQHINCDIATNKKFGIKLDVVAAQQADFDRAFNEILNNPTYRESATKLSTVFRDRPLKPRDEAVFWIEYVIRHGKNVLRSRAVDLKWWQAELLDVYAFIAASVAVLLGCLVFFAQLLIGSFIRKMRKFSLSVNSRRSKKVPAMVDLIDDNATCAYRDIQKITEASGQLHCESKRREPEYTSHTR
ncbi:UDP-glucuronosyltransferase-like [Copidosoma floridanum]|uniref:UDP-glucuronosyltransferase-like n=1 Tax=Copidosoma floridanum TaxID=29053 RepID=UPI0006C988D6|nr:UDP-glucuronosyltransferase-like [Copidosoma floridanum]